MSKLHFPTVPRASGPLLCKGERNQGREKSKEKKKKEKSKEERKGREEREQCSKVPRDKCCLMGQS